MDQSLKIELGKIVAGAVSWDRELRDFTSFCIGGPADALISVTTRSELMALVALLTHHELRWRVIGKGTNLLVPDAGYRGVALILKGQLREIHSLDSHADILEVGAGCSLARLVAYCQRQGLAGLEFAAGIPGSVGGAVIMNAGAWGCAFEERIVEVDILRDGEVMSCDREQLAFSYRRAMGLCDTDIVLSVKLALQAADPQEIRSHCHDLLARRKQIQPAGVPNAGSIFKNPVGDSAGRLIDICGLKGTRFGDAEVSERHANFIVNRGGATADDVLRLMEYVQNVVKEKSGVVLEPEVHILC